MPSKRRKVKKPFMIESKWTSPWFKGDRDWSIYNRTERVRDEALRNLQRKAYPHIEYRAAA